MDGITIRKIADEVVSEYGLRAILFRRHMPTEEHRIAAWIEFRLESGLHVREFGVDLLELQAARDPEWMLRDVLRCAAHDFARHAANG